MTNLLLELGVIYGGSAILATLFLYLKQPMVLSYIFSGVIFGPSILGWVTNPQDIEHFSHFGIILLMFLIGLELDVKELVKLLKKSAPITIGSSLIFATLGFLTLVAFNIPLKESLIAGLALMFSSTVVGLKLIPTTDLHQKRLGEIMISVLLFQDIIAIIVILMLAGGGGAIYTVVPLRKLLKSGTLDTV